MNVFRSITDYIPLQQQDDNDGMLSTQMPPVLFILLVDNFTWKGDPLIINS